MKTRIGLATLAALGFAAVTAIPAHTKESAGIHDTRKTQSKDCTVNGQKEGVFTYNGPDSAWPPNHKMRYGTITLTDVDSPEEEATDGVTLIVGASHDEFSEGQELNGSGNTPYATDASGGTKTGTDTVTVPISMRGERSGRGDGRVYTFDTTGSSVDGGLPVGSKVCAPVQFTVTVPHDQRNQTNTGINSGGKS